MLPNVFFDHISPNILLNHAQITVKFDYRSVDQLMEIQSGRGPLSQSATGFISTSSAASSLVIYLKSKVI